MHIKLVTEVNPPLPKEIAGVLITICGIAIVYLITAYAAAMAARIKVFRRSFMNQFDEEHNTHFPLKKKAPEFGYPDCGTGRYSLKLSYKDWCTMAVGQRL